MKRARDKEIEIQGVMYDIVAFLSEDGTETDKCEEACTLVLQRPEDARPQGIKQAYKAVRIVKGSLAPRVDA